MKEIGNMENNTEKGSIFFLKATHSREIGSRVKFMVKVFTLTLVEKNFQGNGKKVKKIFKDH